MNNTNQYLTQIINTPSLNQANAADTINQVEIVVPIFNAYAAVKKCLHALLQHTPNRHPITLLDDASSDKQLTEYLHSISQQHQHIRLITRRYNLGYLNNINSHLKSCKHAVVLLNSDTEVTADWLDFMLAVAADSHIGVVCPLSDNATLLSLPNSKPERIELLQQLHALWFPIPTAVGFCMLIKAGIWQQLHGFDPYYQPGYGEECDFSLSIRQQGLQVACAPAAFVYHRGSESFKQQSIKLRQQHQYLLDLRWPTYAQEIKQFIDVNPVHWIQQWLLSQETHQPRVLHVVHGLENKGGVELFSKKLIQSLDDTYHHTVLINNPGKKSEHFSSDQHFELIEINMNAFNSDHLLFDLPADLYQSRLDAFFKQMLHWGGFGFVHFHSTVGIGTAIWPQLCHQLEIPYALFFHDHSGLCQIFSLSTTVNQQEIYCGRSFSDANDQQCQQCLRGKTRKSRLTTQSYLSLHQQIWHDNIQHANHLQFCSDYLLAIYSQRHHNISNKSLVLNPCFFGSQSIATKPITKNRVKLAFLGQFGVLKGAQLFIDLYHHMSGEAIDWQIIGGIDPIYLPQLESTEISTQGSYEESELPHLLDSIDLIVFTAQIPETYGITLTEAMINGIPVVAPDIGAYPSRLTNQQHGLLYKANNIHSLAAAVTQLIDLQKSQQRIRQINYTAPHRQATIELSRLYQASIIQRAPGYWPKYKRLALLPPPKANAYQVMQKWLDAPMTLEAEADWKPSPRQCPVIIIGEQADAISQTTSSLLQHLTDPVIQPTKTAHLFTTLADAESVLIIHAGNLVNENMGNWLAHFIQDKAVAGLADFALHNHQQQVYAPQFMGTFSWQNLSANQANIGCILLKPKLIQALSKQTFWSTQFEINSLLCYLHKVHNKQVTHFPYFSYSMADHLFARHWKQPQQTFLAANKQTTNKVVILIETQLSGHALFALKLQFQQQLWSDSITAEFHFLGDETKTLLLDSIDFNDCAVFVLADNVRLTDNGCLQHMLKSLHQSHVDALTIPAARDLTGHYLVAKKTGAANHFQGIGRIKDLRFTEPNAIHEHEWLDDDCWLFKAKAWQCVTNIYRNDNSLFTALKLSVCLQKNDFSIGVLTNSGMYKKGLPTRHKAQTEMSLKNQREDVIKAEYHFPVHSHYPQSFSCRQSSQLDLVMTSFKTPKHLPRVLAYAQDEWASGFYRVKSPLNALAAENKISVHFLSADAQQTAPTPFEIKRMNADALILHGYYADHQLAALNQYKKQLNIKIIISIDDLLTDIPNYNPFAKNTPTDIKTRIKLACSLADTLVVSTAELANHFKNYHPQITVIPNRLSQHIWPKQPKAKENHKRLRVGWAGAGQHQQDLAWLSQVVECTQSFCDWVFFGDKPAAIEHLKFEFHPPVDLLHYPEKLQQLQLDLGVAPLIDNPFNRAKSALKLMEYGVLGLPVLASDLPCYQNSPAILLDNDVARWVEQLEYHNLNRNLLQEKGQAMLNWVHQGYWLEDHQSQWLAVLGLD